MALVEAVAGELVDLLEDLRRLAPAATPRGDGAVDEGLALRVHLGLDLLAHGAAQQIGAAERVAGQHLRDLHHLLLVDHDAEGLLQDAFERRMQIVGLLLAVLAGDVVGDVVHRARAIERDQGDDVLEAVGLQLAQHVAHARTFELEHADRLAAAEHLVGLPVVERNAREIELDAALLQQLAGERQHGERLEAEEVELHQPGLLDVLHVELRRRQGGARIAVERHQLVERAVADDDAGGVGRGVAVEAFELLRDVDQARDRRILVAQMLERGIAVDRLLQGDGIGRVVRHHLAEPVDLAVGHLQHAADVAQDGARLQRAEGDDLGDAVAAVFLLDVADHLVAAVFAEVDVEVRHRHALGIEEALEQQAAAQRIEIGDGERPGDDRAGAGAAAGTDRNALRLRPLDEVGDDQEVAGEAHLLDDAELELEALAIGLGGLGAGRGIHLGLVDMRLQPALQPLGRAQAQLLGLGAPGGDGEGRQDRLALRRHEGAAAGDDERVVDRLRQVGEQGAHLGGGLEVVLGRQAAALLLADIGAAGDAEQRVVRLEHGAVGEEGVVGGDQRQVVGIGEIDQALLDARLRRQAVAHQLDVEAAGEQAPSGAAGSSRRHRPGRRRGSGRRCRPGRR